MAKEKISLFRLNCEIGDNGELSNKEIVLLDYGSLLKSLGFKDNDIPLPYDDISIVETGNIKINCHDLSYQEWMDGKWTWAGRYNLTDDQMERYFAIVTMLHELKDLIFKEVDKMEQTYMKCERTFQTAMNDLVKAATAKRKTETA